MKNLLHSTDSSDVTLVCDDKTKFKAHKFVLRACSTFFQSILMAMPPKGDSVIYLRGVLSQEMKSILQFMNVAKTLEVKEISKEVESNTSDSPQNDKCDKY